MVDTHNLVCGARGRSAIGDWIRCGHFVRRSDSRLFLKAHLHEKNPDHRTAFVGLSTCGGYAAAWLLVASFISAALLPVDPQDSVAGSTLNAVLVPSFGMFAFTQFLMVPLGIKAYHTVGVSSIGTLDQFVANCNAMWNVSRVPLVILFAFSVVLAILCYRRHRRIAERSSLLWACSSFCWVRPDLLDMSYTAAGR